MSNKVSTYNSHTYYKHHISQYINISYHLHTSFKHSSKNLLLKAISYERQKLIKSKALLMEGNITHI